MTTDANDDREPRVTRLPVEGSTGGVRELFDAFQRTRGNVPNLFRVAAHRAPIVETLHRHMQAVMGPGTVPVLLKEFLSVRVSYINGCRY